MRRVDVPGLREQSGLEHGDGAVGEKELLHRVSQAGSRWHNVVESRRAGDCRLVRAGVVQRTEAVTHLVRYRLKQANNERVSWCGQSTSLYAHEWSGIRRGLRLSCSGMRCTRHRGRQGRQLTPAPLQWSRAQRPSICPCWKRPSWATATQRVDTAVKLLLLVSQFFKEIDSKTRFSDQAWWTRLHSKRANAKWNYSGSILNKLGIRDFESKLRFIDFWLASRN